jgi:hypothetical protein
MLSAHGDWATPLIRTREVKGAGTVTIERTTPTAVLLF